MAVTAVFVTAATIIAERLGAIVGALVATLPVSAGPVYVFLALDHDATFISASAVTSLVLNAATAIFVTVYVLTAQRRSLWVSMSLAFSAALGRFGPGCRRLDCFSRIRFQRDCLLALLLHCQAILSRAHANDDNPLV